MHFYQPKKKPVNVPILSLLDILAILLIYTIVSSQFKKTEEESQTRQQASLKVDIPSHEGLSTKNVAEKRMQIVLAADGRIELDGTVIEENVFVDYLKALKETKSNVKLEVKADKEVTLQQGIFLLESLKKAGIPAEDVPLLIKERIRF